ncbi:MAG TPA: hypothetical protein VKO83_10620 [Steroidobacteraceae bacterium]|nr:hypothetical protein [Steroidobacteraceae bacterium]
MNQEHDDFARQHPALDRALREQLKGPVMDAAFRRQVMARIATRRAALTNAAVPPERVRSRLRAQLLLQVLNTGAIALAAALVLGVAAPRLGSLRISSWLQQDWGLPVALTVAGVALIYGLQRAGVLGWVRRLDF